MNNLLEMCWVGNEIKAGGKQMEHNTNNRYRRQLLGATMGSQLRVFPSRALDACGPWRESDWFMGMRHPLLKNEGVGSYQRISGVLYPEKGC